MNDLGGWIFLAALVICFSIFMTSAPPAHEGRAIGLALMVTQGGRTAEVCDAVLSLVIDGNHVNVTCASEDPMKTGTIIREPEDG